MKDLQDKLLVPRHLHRLQPPLRIVKNLVSDGPSKWAGFSMQVQGNEQFTRGVQMNKKFYLQQAIVKYTEGLKTEGLPAGAVKSILYSNRAQVGGLKFLTRYRCF